jgi:hypothetical protein
MLDTERDRLIIEMHQDIKWIKTWNDEHKQTHSKYLYYFIVTVVAIIASYFR